MIMPGANTWRPVAALLAPATVRFGAGPVKGTVSAVVQVAPLASMPENPKVSFAGTVVKESV